MTDLLTCAQVAELFRVNRGTIRAWTAKRKIPSVKIGPRTIRYRRNALESFLLAGERPARRPPHAPEHPGDGEGGRAMSARG